MYAKMWAASGLSYPALLDRLIALAQEHREAAAGCLAGNAAAIDPAADDGHVEVAPRCAWPISHRFHDRANGA